jgi:hypothetical protein
LGIITNTNVKRTKIVKTYMVHGDVSLRYWFCLRLYVALIETLVKFALIIGIPRESRPPLTFLSNSSIDLSI